MRKTALPYSALGALAGCAAAVGLAPLESLPRDSRPPADCALEVRFGSVCCGPDVAMWDRIHKAALADPRVIKAYDWAWGEEGESSLCLVLRTPANAATLAAEYRTWIAARPQPMLTSVEIEEIR